MKIVKPPDKYDSKMYEDNLEKQYFETMAEPDKMCPYCGCIEGDVKEVYIKDLPNAKELYSSKLDYILYRNILKYRIRKCRDCGAIWTGEQSFYRTHEFQELKNLYYSLEIIVFIILLSISCIVIISIS